jgi:ABC-type multidrug transport system ATPase subunit
MSEEILRAMMELFALIVKQDGGMLGSERDYVSEFLTKQLTHRNADEFMDLFLENAGPLRENTAISEKGAASVRDSIRIFHNCTKINKTLTQEQRVIVLLRCFELVDSDKQYTPQRMNIINTIAEVFKISQDEFGSIMLFVKSENKEDFSDPSMLVISTDISSDRHDDDDQYIVFLKVASVNLYFLRSFRPGITLLNGLRLTPRKVFTFAPGSSVQAAPASPIYYSDIISQFISDKDIHRISFVTEKLCYNHPDGAPAISSLSFTAREGKLIGIMGASGSGKTTLLNLLTGLLKPASGDVRINGISIYADDPRLEGAVGFVPQDDLLAEDLTVFQNLYYAAAFCFAGKTKAELASLVNQTLQSLGLYEKKDYRVGSPLSKVISGGQRKRLNIALELIREPSVLFVDEPTSGLSSSDSANVMDLLHELTLRGKLVITVIHQPSSEIFKGFDNVLVLDMDGMMVFYGNPIESVVYFRTLESHINREVGECPTCGNVNPEILFNILETRVVDEYGRYTEKRKVSPSEWAEAFRNISPPGKLTEEDQVPYSSLRRPGLLRQTFLFLGRDVRRKLANRQYMLITLLEGPVLGLILSYIIRYIADPASTTYIFRENENIPVFIFMSIIVALFLGLTISAEEIFRDRNMLRREHFLHLSRDSYLLNKVLVLACISALQSFLFLLVANNVLGIKGLFFPYWLTLFATALCANILGLNISSALNSAIAIYIVIPLLMIPMMILSGAMFPFDKLNRKLARVDKVPVVADLMPTRWGYEALMVKQFTGNEYGRRVYPLKQQMSISDFNTIYRIPLIADALEVEMESRRYGQNMDPDKNRLDLIRNEIRTIGSTDVVIPFTGTDSLTPELFSTGLGRRAAYWLNSADREFRRLGTIADMNLDNYISNNREVLNRLYNNYHNDKLEDIVRKVYERNKVLEYNNMLVQNVDLIYLEPAPSGLLDYRTHFMAPVKAFLGMKIDTFTFNISLLFFSVIVFYLLLRFEVLGKLIKFLETVRFQKRKATTVN